MSPLVSNKGIHGKQNSIKGKNKKSIVKVKQEDANKLTENVKENESNNFACTSQNDILSTDIKVREVMWKKHDGLSVIIPMTIRDVKIKAVVDSAAQVTVISKELFEKISSKGAFQGENVNLICAGKSTKIGARKVNQVIFYISNRKYVMSMYVADINDDMLLGVDFLSKYRAVIDFKNNLFTVDDLVIPLITIRDKENLIQVSQLKLNKKQVIPPESVAMLECGTTGIDGNINLIVSPGGWNKGLLVPNCVVKSGSKVMLKVINDTSSYIYLKKNTTW